MQYSFDAKDLGLAISIQGRMTHADYKGFREILNKIDVDKPRQVVFHLGQVEFMDSSALGMLLIVRDAAAREQRTVTLKGGSGQVEKLIQVAKLKNYFNIE